MNEICGEAEQGPGGQQGKTRQDKEARGRRGMASPPSESYGRTSLRFMGKWMTDQMAAQ